MNVFELSENLRELYGDFIRGYIPIRDPHIRTFVEQHLEAGVLWPPPLIQINPRYQTGSTLEDLIQKHGMDRRVLDAFREDPASSVPLYRHQEEAIELALQGRPFLITTGTGSGKTWSYLIPILNHVLQDGAKPDTPYAVLVYPMNALVNSQLEELRRLKHNYENIHGEGTFPVRFARFTGQESEEEKAEIRNHPPHILLTNYVMMELLLLRHEDRNLRRSIVESVRFYVMDEIHTYRGRQGADVALMNRRFLSLFDRVPLCIGASATMVSDEEGTARREAVARFATRFFGIPFEPDQVVEESLERRTEDRRVSAQELRDVFHHPEKALQALESETSFRSHPLFIWMENTFGVRRDADGRLRRQIPRRVEEGVEIFLQDAQLPDTQENRDQVEQLLEQAFLRGAEKERFSFKLHLFFSQGGDIRATLAVPPEIRVHPVNEIDGLPAFPIQFCRVCGQHFYVGILDDREKRFLPLEEEAELEHDTDTKGPRRGYGYLMVLKAPLTPPLRDRLPEEWFTRKGSVKSTHVSRIPEDGLWVRPDGTVLDQPPSGEEEKAYPAVWIPRPFSFCPSCGVYYTRKETEYRKLADLGTEGRALATTVHILSLLPELPGDMRKVLSFTDNRQDAVFQAGFFNDFVQTLILRAALREALVRHKQLDASSIAPAVVAVLREKGMNLQHFVAEKFRSLRPETPTAARAWKILEDAVEILLFNDIGREWRVLYPNLEQTGLLHLDYQDLRSLIQSGELQKRFPELPEDVLHRWIRAFLDTLRLKKAVDVPWLSRRASDLQRNLEDYLNEFWIPSEDQLKVRWGYLEKGTQDPQDGISFSAQSAFGQWALREFGWERDRYTERMDKLVEILLAWGFLVPAKGNGFRLSRSQLLWRPGDGETITFVDVFIKQVPGKERPVDRINPFFRDLYTRDFSQWLSLRAAEHTAQVSYERRIQREADFREGRLPVIFCSPTMELGIDIRDLLVVHMRNVPPTPANYAQRSGRAGRKGQPALVVTYCGQNSHDQYFFDRPQEMVSGEVRAPRIDFGSEDLLRSHIHAMWFEELNIKIGNEMGEHLLDVETLSLSQEIRTAHEKHILAHKDKILRRVFDVVNSLWEVQSPPEWFSEHWVKRTFLGSLEELNRAMEFWRELYQHALKLKQEGDDLANHGKTKEQRKEGRRKWAQGQRLIETLRNENQDTAEASEFYPYRYLASEGFFPAYAFPPRPMRAMVTLGETVEWIQRPSWIAISEFAPFQLLYHEGNRYAVSRALLPEVSVKGNIRVMKFCETCGYFTDEKETDWNPDRCPSCGANLETLSALPLPHVDTYRRARITSEEASRIRGGMDITVLFRKTEETASGILRTGKIALPFQYLPRGKIRILNHGYWILQTRFYVLPEKGEFFLSQKTRRLKEEERAQLQPVSLFVDMLTDALVLDPSPFPDARDTAGARKFIFSLAYALLLGFTHAFELEERELGVTVFSSPTPRILFYESAVGGLSVFRRLQEEPPLIRAVARAALERLHFHPDTGENLKDPCTSACYGCLLSYTNQLYHHLMNRFLVREFLQDLAREGTLEAERRGPEETRQERLQRLLSRTDSSLERAFLKTLAALGGRLPDAAQVQIPGVFVEADFFYEDTRTCVFIDGPVHDDPRQKEEDRRKRLALEERGYRVVVIRHDEDMAAAIRRHRDVFGV